MQRLRFIDLFSGLGGFHRALTELGHECVFASEIDDELRSLYAQNFPEMEGKVFGDIRLAKALVPDHDMLCAGFPCQPFSKSGSQLGTRDETRGTLFHEILEILEKKKPRYVLLENVGNFGRHDSGRTWTIVRRRLEALGYAVAGTEHVTPISNTDWRDGGLRTGRPANNRPSKSLKQDPGPGLLSPHHFGEPHHRERFFIIASLEELPSSPLPARRSGFTTSLETIVQRPSELTAVDRQETALTAQQIQCIELWNELLARLPEELEFPPAPIWGDEFLVQYPYSPFTPYAAPIAELRKSLGRAGKRDTRQELMELLPRYAREDVATFRHWKVNYIARNREWWGNVERVTTADWRARLAKLPPSLRKLEWNVKGEKRDLWSHVLQFRPSGLRVKRYTSSPALVAMTTTQIPILGPERRFLTRIEGLRLQGFPDNHLLPRTRAAAFKALGNGVHVAVVKAIARKLLNQPTDLPAVHLAGSNNVKTTNNSSRGNNVHRAA